ncbi:SprT family zinc-dependent metalloprotease [soil metagenome]
MSNQVSYGNTQIAYSVKRASRKTLAIEVHPDKKVVVVAPFDATAEKIHSKVEKRAAWIAKQLRYFSKGSKPTRKAEWVSGENIYYLGRQYRLKILKGKDDVKLDGGFLKITINDKSNNKRIRALANKWYRDRAKECFAKQILKQDNILFKEKVKINKIQVRQLSKRWGSCTKQGNIILNVDLVKAPVQCIDYVIIHEICHLKHYNHGRKFFLLLEKHCPDWEKRKSKLEGFAD